MGDWKLVAEWEGPWELYNMADDRTELNDLAESESTRLAAMQKTYFEWAEHAGVREWPVLPSVVAKRLKGKHAHISQHRRPPSGGMR